jgi:hypothetical protein
MGSQKNSKTPFLSSVLSADSTFKPPPPPEPVRSVDLVFSPNRPTAGRDRQIRLSADPAGQPAVRGSSRSAPGPVIRSSRSSRACPPGATPVLRHAEGSQDVEHISRQTRQGERHEGHEVHERTPVCIGAGHACRVRVGSAIRAKGQSESRDRSTRFPLPREDLWRVACPVLAVEFQSAPSGQPDF